MNRRDIERARVRALEPKSALRAKEEGGVSRLYGQRHERREVMKVPLIAVGLALAIWAAPAQAHKTSWGITKVGAQSSLHAYGIDFSDGFWEVEKVQCRGEMAGSFTARKGWRTVRYFKHLWCVFDAYDADEDCSVIGTLRYHVTGRNPRNDEIDVKKRELEWFCN